MNGASGLGVAVRAQAVPAAPSPRADAGAETFALLLPAVSAADGGDAAPATARTCDLFDAAADLAQQSATALLAVATWSPPVPMPAPDPPGATAKLSPPASAATPPSTTMALVDASRTLARTMPAACAGLLAATPQDPEPAAPTSFAAGPPAATRSGTQADAAPPPAHADAIGPAFAPVLFAPDAPAGPQDLPTGPTRDGGARVPDARATAAPSTAPHAPRAHRSPPQEAASARDATAPAPATMPPAPAPTFDTTAADDDASDEAAAAPTAVASPAPRDALPHHDRAPVVSPAEVLAPAAAPPPRHAAPPTPVVHSPQFGDAFGAHVTWLAEQRAGEAQIRVSPDELGPIDIRLRFDGDTVRADFGSAHAEVRAAIEAQLPRLRELLSAHGLELAGAGVGSSLGDAPSRPQPAPPQRTDVPGGAAAPAAEPERIVRAVRGLFDAYA